MTEVISVRFRGGCKNYYFDPGSLQVKMGDQVIVETAQGPEFATCTEGNHEVDEKSATDQIPEGFSGSVAEYHQNLIVTD